MKASATSSTLMGAKRARARASGRIPALMRRRPAKRLVSESPAPKITDGRKIVTDGCGCAERAHVQHAAHAGGARCGHHLGGELGVHRLEGVASTLVEDADEIDDGRA